MPVCLLDVNTLIALAWPNHTHYAKAQAWFNARSPDSWATCPITQCGFVRISSNSKIMPSAASPQAALELLEKFTNRTGHVFWQNDMRICDPDFMFRNRIRGHQQVTDAYLLGLTIRHGGQIATLDQGIMSLASTPQEREAIILIPT